jgi:hypothetical protein
VNIGSLSVPTNLVETVKDTPTLSLSLFHCSIATNNLPRKSSIVTMLAGKIKTSFKASTFRLWSLVIVWWFLHHTTARNLSTGIAKGRIVYKWPDPPGYTNVSTSSILPILKHRCNALVLHCTSNGSPFTHKSYITRIPFLVSFLQCKNDYIKNGNFEDKLNFWTTDPLTCAKDNGNNPIANNLDALMTLTPTGQNTVTCTLSQPVDVGDINVVYAELIWVDRPSTETRGGGGSAQVFFREANKEPNEVFNNARNVLDARNKLIFLHIRDVTGYVKATKKFNVELIARAAGTNLNEEWDNVQLTVCTEVKNGNDPHFTTWKGEKYSYHGACDLLLLHSDQFGNGLGMDIHIRTKHRRNFSFISHLALRIGNEVFEVAGKKQYYLNGIENVAMPNKIMDYKIKQQVNHHTGYPSYTIHINECERIIITTWKDIVSISFEGESEDNYADSVGLMGNYYTGDKLGRNGMTIFTNDYNAFGQEWQVRSDEPHLFQTLEAASTMCTLPEEHEVENVVKRRRLGESISEESAKKACEHVGAEDMDFCVFDVMSTGDVDMASTYAY